MKRPRMGQGVYLIEELRGYMSAGANPKVFADKGTAARVVGKLDDGSYMLQFDFDVGGEVGESNRRSMFPWQFESLRGQYRPQAQGEKE